MDAEHNAHSRVDELDLDTRSQCAGKAKQSALHALGNYKQAISINLATTAGHFSRDPDLDLANVDVTCPACFCSLLRHIRVAPA